nr:3'-5' exonuclease [Bacilli bacterium]
DYVGDDLTLGYYLYDEELRLLGQGMTSSPEEAVSLLEENLPITYDFNYLSRDILDFYDMAGKDIGGTKPFMKLFGFYRYKRDFHFYVDVVECLINLGKREEEIFPYGDDGLDPKERARLNRMVYEEMIKRYSNYKPLSSVPATLSYIDKSTLINRGIQDRYDLIDNHMDELLEKKDFYVFFDIECANTDFEEGKICEFSYVVYDSSWKRIKSKEILINPGVGEEYDFKLLGRPGSTDLHLKYEANNYEAYRNSPEFSEFANEIKDLLEDPNALIFGYEVESDLRFLAYSFKRYGVQVRDLVAIDVKRVYENILGKTMHSLGDLVDRFVPKQEAEKLQFHTALDDATATGLVLRYFLLMKGMDIKDLLKKVTDSMVCDLWHSFYPCPDLADPECYEKLKKDGLI